ncbi:MAG TPA: hypothetical protein DCL61_09960 [Cyanobacteria bacterium UBA12227]|nr:hypothetical protein [Cyanobacteria bacterium UBA12227]HAX85883.1 hypothetical protein [Cyanobacteria bacterium UBA11370]HBY75699.1 hypothetical protein [Cyanobacteria bacterium UBA11148]
MDTTTPSTDKTSTTSQNKKAVAKAQVQVTYRAFTDYDAMVINYCKKDGIPELRERMRQAFSYLYSPFAAAEVGLPVNQVRQIADQAARRLIDYAIMLNSEFGLSLSPVIWGNTHQSSGGNQFQPIAVPPKQSVASPNITPGQLVMDELDDGDEADKKEQERDQRIQEMLDEARLANPETAFLGKGKWHDPFN